MPQPIALSEILGYCREMGITGVPMKDAMIELVQAMDDVFIEHMSEQRAAKKPESDVVT